jgi:hypothetical protein
MIALAALAVVKLLLAKDGVDPDSNDTDGLPYKLAALNRYEGVEQILVIYRASEPKEL